MNFLRCILGCGRFIDSKVIIPLKSIISISITLCLFFPLNFFPSFFSKFLIFLKELQA